MLYSVGATAISSFLIPAFCKPFCMQVLLVVQSSFPAAVISYGNTTSIQAFWGGKGTRCDGSRSLGRSGSAKCSLGEEPGSAGCRSPAPGLGGRTVWS